MKVRDVMTQDVAVVGTDTALADALRLMLAKGISGVPVVDKNHTLVGILTEGDVLRRSELDTEHRRSRWGEFLAGPGKLASEYVATHGRRIEELMTAGVLTVTPETELSEAVDLMERNHIKLLPVLANGRLAGILSRADLLRELLMSAEKTAAPNISDVSIRQRITTEIQRQSWSAPTTIQVGVRAGVVDLRGIIIDERMRMALRVLVENIPGVIAVHDHLAIVDLMSGYVMQAASEA